MFWQDWWTWPIEYLTRFLLILVLTLTLYFQGQIWNLLYHSQKCPIAMKLKAYQLNFRPQIWPMDLTLAMTLTLNFQGQIWNLPYLSQKWYIDTEQKANISTELLASNMAIRFDISHDLDLEFSRSKMEIATAVYLNQKWSNCHETKSKHIDWPVGLKCDHQDMTLTFNFQGQIWNLLHPSQKWSDCHETKRKHIDWPLGVECDHQIWPWPWPWIFKVKFGICYMSTKNGSITTKLKANISVELNATTVTIRFDLGHDLER